MPGRTPNDCEAKYKLCLKASQLVIKEKVISKIDSVLCQEIPGEYISQKSESIPIAVKGKKELLDKTIAQSINRSENTKGSITDFRKIQNNLALPNNATVNSTQLSNVFSSLSVKE